MAIADHGGVLTERCYGCGRCLPACPLGLIEDQQQWLDAEAVPALLRTIAPDAVELHTQAGRQTAFEARLNQLKTSGIPLQRVAVSCGLERGAGSEQAPALSPQELASELWLRFDALRRAGYRPLWQLDGRPMSGDVGAGTARSAVKLLEAITPWAPPGPLQLAGGTNANTITLLGPQARAAGVAFGGMARSLLQPWLQNAEERGQPLREIPTLEAIASRSVKALIQPWLER